ncbi:alanyl-tRNA editing protein [Chromobacterium phragmitis]|uniref:Threonyl/alanyl tRNA synthetase SAD domain-containing protein n=1 Tax=Chromobacterium phragmitis TaxID=2202141 RepID=A0A344UF71_9NEIS|nr:alanyl-tRNA editing protein [Chromobacterium phragmitis]AXE33919.1 hypothetical protein DK843_06110 [Chromobacterium phragmitis]
MQQRLYYLSDETECDSAIVSSGEQDGRFFAILAATLFHPQGGGQLADGGWIDDCKVLSVESLGEAILHVTERLLPPGPVRLRVDADKRALHSRLHSAGHLIGTVGIDLGLRPDKAQHWPEASRVVFRMEETAPPEAGEWEDKVNHIVAQNLPRQCGIQDGARMVGFGRLPAFPCGGTHVRSLADIGRIRILSVKTKKDTVTVNYDIL